MCVNLSWVNKVARRSVFVFLWPSSPLSPGIRKFVKRDAAGFSTLLEKSWVTLVLRAEAVPTHFGSPQAASHFCPCSASDLSDLGRSVSDSLWLVGQTLAMSPPPGLHRNLVTRSVGSRFPDPAAT